jgi:hypothetical protein
VPSRFQNSFYEEKKEEISPAAAATFIALPHRRQCIMMQQLHGAAGHVVCGNAGMQWNVFLVWWAAMSWTNVVCVIKTVKTNEIATDDVIATDNGGHDDNVRGSCFSHAWNKEETMRKRCGTASSLGTTALHGCWTGGWEKG